MHLRRPYLNVRVLTVFLIAAVPLSVLGLRIVLSNAQDQLRDSFGRQLEQAAERTAAAVDAYVYRRIIDVSLLARQPALRDTAAAASRVPYDERRVAELDRTWTASRAVPPALASMLQSPASRLLRDLVQHDPVYREILLTDRHGRLAAVSSVSTDYFQGDEDWWRAAFEDSAAGRVTVSDVRWDDSARVYGLEIASPVPDTEGQGSAGILKVVADVREMLAVVAGVQTSGSSGAMLVRRDGSIVFSRLPLAPGARFFANGAFQEKLRRPHDPQASHHFAATSADGRQLVGVAPSQLGLSYPNLSWFVAVWQAEDELLAPTRAQMWQLLLVLALTGLIVLALALLFSMRLVAPPTDVDMELVTHAKVHQIDERDAEEGAR
ncbi:MAG TPA: cache domain-containing protein [Vicinamibacterales bacterium]|jgi:hypothetical protein|nr:cache domain-containing protein [Vicinamibacterales bacterium]